MEDLFLFRTHNKINSNGLKKELEKSCKKTKKVIYFKQEPFILHVCCFNLDSAKKILKIAQDSGIKQKNIISLGNKIICELKASEKIELPVIFDEEILINDKFLKILVEEANKKLEKSWKKIRILEKGV